MNTMSMHMSRIVTLLGALAVCSMAHADARPTRVYTLTPSTHGNPEGVAADPVTGTFFVGATGDGTIYRGRLDSPTLEEFIPGAAGRVAVGLKVARGRLYVAGGGTGDLVVYDLVTRRQVAAFSTGTGGFLNDLVVTPGGDVFVTDSFRPTLWHVTAAQVRAGTGTPEAISVAPEIVYEPGAFNANGIVQLDARTLLVVLSSSGALFRIDLERAGRRITRLEGDVVLGGDGMLLDRGRLIVVQGSPAQLTFVALDHRASRATIVDVLTDPTLRGPATVALSRGRFLVVNSDFATSTPPFTVSGIARTNSVSDEDDCDEDLE